MKHKFKRSMTVLGVSKVSVFNRVTLVSDVVKELNIKEGDRIVFEKVENGKICIRKG